MNRPNFRQVRLREGYDIEEVDAFIADVEHALSTRQRDAGLPDRILSVRFKPRHFRTSYDMDEVDAYLDALQARASAEK